MNIEDYKKTSFVANLSNEDIKELVNICGYRLDYRIVDDSDGMRQTIERVYDSRNRKVRIEVCAINKAQEEIYNKIASKSGLFSIFDKNRFITTILIINDYTMYDMIQSMKDESVSKDMQETFIQYMYNKFGEKYRTNYNKYATRQIHKNNKDNLEK